MRGNFSNRGRGRGRNQQQPCSYFVRTGNCRYGASCKFKHDQIGSEGSDSDQDQAGPSNSGNSNSINFGLAKNLIASLKAAAPSKIAVLISSAKKEWLDLWQNNDALNLHDLNVIITTVSRIPASISASPMVSIHDCASAMERFIELSRNAIGKGDARLSEPVEIVLNAVNRLLKFVWDLERGDVRKYLTSLLCEASSILVITNSDHRKIQTLINNMIEGLEKPWAVKAANATDAVDLTSMDDSADTPQEVALFGVEWKKANIQWLQKLVNFQPNLMPSLKVPNSASNGLYNSPGDYFQTITKLWIAMTFSDGNSALSPHCKAFDNDKECGRPLWLTTTGNLNTTCRTSGCHKQVIVMCCNRFHDNGLCDECFTKAQADLRGSPGRNSSTHVYDAVVTSCSFDNRIFFNSVASRKPPKVAISWRFTRRLQSPNLVGIVPIPTKGISLSRTDRIYWAEIVSHAAPNDEFRLRENGKLVVSLLNLGDDDASQPHIVPGENFAIIDCQTFVPEYLPLLKALEEQQKLPLPFDGLSLLNIGTKHESTHTIEYSSADEDDVEITVELDEIQKRVKSLIEESDLEPIINIRRNGDCRMKLAKSLENLIRSATLDPDQLDSFVNSLIHPVHCTQGPPGTGKSYTGVVMVRALLIIRELWARQGAGLLDLEIGILGSILDNGLFNIMLFIAIRFK